MLEVEVWIFFRASKEDPKGAGARTAVRHDAVDVAHDAELEGVALLMAAAGPEVRRLDEAFRGQRVVDAARAAAAGARAAAARRPRLERGVRPDQLRAEQLLRRRPDRRLADRPRQEVHQLRRDVARRPAALAGLGRAVGLGPAAHDGRRLGPRRPHDLQRALDLLRRDHLPLDQVLRRHTAAVSSGDAEQHSTAAAMMSSGAMASSTASGRWSSGAMASSKAQHSTDGRDARPPP